MRRRAWTRDTEPSLSDKAARSAIVQRRRGVAAPTRELYYEAHSLLRTLRHYLDLPRAA